MNVSLSWLEPFRLEPLRGCASCIAERDELCRLALLSPSARDVAPVPTWSWTAMAAAMKSFAAFVDV